MLKYIPNISSIGRLTILWYTQCSHHIPMRYPLSIFPKFHQVPMISVYSQQEFINIHRNSQLKSPFVNGRSRKSYPNSSVPTRILWQVVFFASKVFPRQPQLFPTIFNAQVLRGRILARSGALGNTSGLDCTGHRAQAAGGDGWKRPIEFIV